MKSNLSKCIYLQFEWVSSTFIRSSVWRLYFIETLYTGRHVPLRALFAFLVPLIGLCQVLYKIDLAEYVKRSHKSCLQFTEWVSRNRPRDASVAASSQVDWNNYRYCLQSLRKCSCRQRWYDVRYSKQIRYWNDILLLEPVDSERSYSTKRVFKLPLRSDITLSDLKKQNFT